MEVSSMISSQPGPDYTYRGFSQNVALSVYSAHTRNTVLENSSSRRITIGKKDATCTDTLTWERNKHALEMKRETKMAADNVLIKIGGFRKE